MANVSKPAWVYRKDKIRGPEQDARQRSALALHGLGTDCAARRHPCTLPPDADGGI